MAARQMTDPLQVPPGSILLVVHDFAARSPDELTLTKGDRIELIERDDDFGDGWFLGRHMNNSKTGLFPEVYTTPAPKGTFTAPATPRPVHVQREVQEAQTPKRPASEDHAKPRPSQKMADNQARYSADAASPRSFSSSSQPSLRASQPPPSQNQVMNETLSVIDEHITDMHTPRQNPLPMRSMPSKESTSVYGSEPDHRFSYINGQETDEEESQMHTEAEVGAWTPAQVADYLEDTGVEKQHCEVFRDQEISGEVLLAMEQSAIFIKEFELGSVGRRLKTWQKVKALQDEVRASAPAGVPRSVSDYSIGGEDSVSDTGRARSASAAPVPAYLAPNDQQNMRNRANPAGRTSTQPYPTTTAPSPSPTLSNSRPESGIRPSAHSIRSMNHSKRHSSIGSTSSMRDAVVSPPTTGHRKVPSMDKTWSFGGATGAEIAARRASGPSHSHKLSGGSFVGQNASDWHLKPDNTAGDLDRGYFSGNEVDNRSNRRSVLQKRSVASASHSRDPSAVDLTATHSRNPSAADVTASNSPLPAAKMDSPISPMVNQTGFGKNRGIRAVTSPKLFGGKTTQPHDSPMSPVVTKLEYGQTPGTTATIASPKFGGSDTSSAAASPAANTHTFSFFNKSKSTNLRIASDAVTQNEKAGVVKQSPVTSPTRTGSTTPSTGAGSFDMQKSDPSRMSTGSSQGLTPTAPTAPAPRARPRTSSKKFTSAYTRGLEKKSPKEQLAGCDYSGWMKKKSASLTGSWKPRLFVLRGRRLSYYYSENDTEEKGLIDISGHRVLPAENEKMTGLHAKLTGAASPTATENHTGLQTSAETDLAAHPSPFPNGDTGLFIFKLVPPRQGLSKAVNFTKPVVHYFAVQSRQEGRLWMAALMKATIDYDASGKVTTSYNQNTISLAKARARKERPPALKEEMGGKDGLKVNGKDVEGTGLGIGGLDPAPVELPADSVAGAEKGSRDSAGLDSLAGSLRDKEIAALIS